MPESPERITTSDGSVYELAASGTFALAGLNKIGYDKTKLVIGQKVLLVREPENVFDKNAIQVKSKDGDTIAYLPREAAAVIAPKMDKRLYPFKAELVQLPKEGLTVWAAYLRFYRKVETVAESGEWSV